MIDLRSLFFVIFSVAPWSIAQDTQQGDEALNISSSHQSCTSGINDTSYNEILSVQRIIEWVRSNGGIFNTKQEFRRTNSEDPSSPFGIFAIEDIEKGELLTRVPWKCIITDPEDKRLQDEYISGHNFHFSCGSTQHLINELRKGEQTFFEPYTSYLRDQPRGKIPSDWSDDGKDLLEEVIGFDMLPPKDMVGLLDLWRYICDVKINDASLEEQALIEYHSRADDDKLVPLIDLYNIISVDMRNAEIRFSIGKEYEYFAVHDIKKGEEIRHFQLDSMHYSTSDYFRDYGIIKPMPQKWTFADPSLQFLLVENEHGNVEVQWLRSPYVEGGEQFLQEQLGRLEDVVGPHLNQIEQEAKSGNTSVLTKTTPPQNELADIRHYYDTVKMAINKGLESMRTLDRSLWGIDADDIDDTAVYTYAGIDPAEEGTRVPDFHENFASYNMQINNPKWKTIEADKSAYQSILWTGDPEKNDVCFLLEQEPQTCSAFRAHYHDVAAHFPTRYLEAVRRVAIIGGGDALMLHEIMKYDTIEKVVHLELDQKVVRKSHKYFASQPFFHDERVEWWFGNAVTSLQMLPSDYFGSFDIVFVDLSESGFLSQTVSHDLTIWELIVNLVSPEGILVKNELYQETLSKFFDNTMVVYYEHVPMIMSWALTIGSNRLDLLNPNTKSLMKWDNIKTVWEDFSASPENFDDHFKFAHDYQRNDAQSQGECLSNETVISDEEHFLGGILLILDAENTSLLGKEAWPIQLGKIYAALEQAGVVPISSLSHSFEDGRGLGAIFMQEGVVLARTWPKENYCAFDIQLWCSFNKLESIQSSLSKVSGSNTESLSSYRIVTNGMMGIGKENEDKEIMGPKNTRSRKCETTEFRNGVFDRNKLESLAIESSQFIQGENGAIAVLCGSIDEFCLSYDVISRKGDSMEIVPLWTCPSIADIEENDKNFTNEMFKCEMEIQNQLRGLVTEKHKLVAFVIDPSATSTMGILADRLWSNPRNVRALLADQFTFIALIKNKHETWRSDFLEWRRREMVDYKHLFRAEVVLTTSTDSLEVGFLSSQDPHFFGRLVNFTKSVEALTGFDAKVQKVEGGIEELRADQEAKWYIEDDFERSAGEAQFAAQRPLADQFFVQLQISNATDIEFIDDILFFAMQDILSEYTDVKMHHIHDVFEGSIIGAISMEGTIVLVWNGNDFIDLNIFGYDAETVETFLEPFELYLKEEGMHVKTVGHDEFPRGTNRVINRLKDLKVWRKTSHEEV